MIVAGQKTSVRYIADKLGEIMEKTPKYRGKESATAQLGDDTRYKTAAGITQFRDGVDDLIGMAALSVMCGMEDWNKPTHFDDPRYVKKNLARYVRQPAGHTS